MFDKVLVANRGEIAVRVIRTARSLGYRTVAVYSEADADALHVRLADQAVCIGPAQVNQSYLRIDAILEAARQTGAGAIHPGYGFLSENADFARACEDAGLVFIGPPAGAIELMGSKRRAKLAMEEAGVPTVPGYQGEQQDDARLIEEAQRIGTPLMVKASAGGGGRGMRLVHELDRVGDEIERARSEARSAFGNDELILEKAVIEPRHIEIQVFADRQGNAIYLGERDCSIQRRHQKVVEEAPSPFVTPDLRRAMGEAAVRAAQACSYVGAGTVEFLTDPEGNFYFLEMNTRLQVEHPVTEMITGQDLVAWQLAVAEGKPLPLTQEQVDLRGHAIEVRLYAEDPAAGFTPQTGTLSDWSPAEGAGIRFDTGVEAGAAVTPWYDPMLAKVIAWGEDRDIARRRLIRALEDSRLFGITSNRRFLARILAHPVFARGEATTAFIESHFQDDPSMQPQPPRGLEWTLAAAIQQALSAGPGAGWSNSLPAPVPFRLGVGEHQQSGRLLVERGDYRVLLAGQERDWCLQLERLERGRSVFSVNGVRQHCQYQACDDHLYLQLDGVSHRFDILTHAPADSRAGAGSGQIKASMDGALIALMVKAGERVEAGQTLAVLEAMKMEHPLKADIDGVVSEVHVSEGNQVKVRQLLVEIQPEESQP